MNQFNRRTGGGFRPDHIPLGPIAERSPPPSRDDVALRIGGRDLVGWTSVRVTRGIDRIPGDFELGFTEPAELAGLAMLVHPGEPCEIRAGADLVVTGYIDRVMPSLDSAHHTVVAVGRGKCQDLVDCSANFGSQQVNSKTVDDIATILAFPFEIGVETLGDMGKAVPRFSIPHGTTPYEVIEHLCRFRQLLAYELPNGNLFLTRAFTKRAASGFEQGVNVLRASANWSMDQRFSDYWVYLQSVSVLRDAGNGGNLVRECKDKTVPRFRLRKIVTETSGMEMGADYAKDRATWEGARRFGRSAELRVTVDSWRDVKGTLFEPGMLVNVDIPLIYATSGPDRSSAGTWVLAEVTYRRDEAGTTLEAVLMPPAAFNPQPTLFNGGLPIDFIRIPQAGDKP